MDSIPLNISDHNMIFFVKKKATIEKVKLSFEGRIYKDYDAVKFKEELCTKDVTNILASGSSPLAWEMFRQLKDATLTPRFPVKNIKTRKPKNEWMSAEIIEQIKYKDNLMIRARQTNSEEDWIEARRAKNNTKLLVAEIKSKCMRSALSDNRKNNKAFWNTVKKVLPSTKAGNGTINLCSEDGSVIPPMDTAKVINDFFINIASVLDVHKIPLA